MRDHWEIQRCCSSKVQPLVHSYSLHSRHLSQPEWLQCTYLHKRVGEEFNSGSISVIPDNPEKYTSFNVSVTVGEYETPLGEAKQIKRQL